ncbi:DNA helicase/exodeoxyribonuclease V alpha subunit [Sphaerotilus hippei]|uniref:RecBCD enzyme subunit RecD n=1 Tax=Sphaerotilus hippei TaxID=744406 RepID=A0A318GY76_9BURK|nr:exodeoxyribonuclease V subunit alpha [Sphaerotilus hippei]PXW94972.1 DNA helicase/exodeoxyribonuclease V alpha subunit [Sphaerotilus hippei]
MPPRQPPRPADPPLQASLFDAVVPRSPTEPTEPPAATSRERSGAAWPPPEAGPASGALPLVLPLPSVRDAAGLLAELSRWAEAGWLRLLDLAFARFVHEQAPRSEPVVLLAAALLAQLEGRGHTCLSLADLLDGRRAALIHWPAAGMGALEATLAALEGDVDRWSAALAASAAVDVDAPDGVSPSPAALGQAPLVWVPRGARLYLRRYWRDEQRVAAQVLQRVGAAAAAGEGEGADPIAHATAPAEVRRWLDLLFHAPPPAAPGDEALEPDWQRIACAVAWSGRLGLITGGPGTGKTYTVARLLVLLEALHPGPEPLRIALAAPTGKAAARLKQSIEAALGPLQAQVGSALDLSALVTRIGAARTLHALLGARPDTRRLARHAGHPLDVDVLVVDEASMVHLEMMAALLEALPSRARLVLLGDKDQLASVEAGAVLGDLCRQAQAGAYAEDTAARVLAWTGQVLPQPMRLKAGQRPSPLAQQTVMLRRSQRFGGPIGQLALAVNAGASVRAWQVLRGPGGSPSPVACWPVDRPVTRLALEGRDGAPGGYRTYAELLARGPQVPSAHGRDDPEVLHEAWVRSVLQAFERFRLLTAVREGDWGVGGLNRAVEAALIGAGLLQRGGEWYEGRPVMVTRNDAAQGVFNGDVGLTLRASPRVSAAGAGTRALRVYFLDGDQLRSVLASRLNQVETAFVMTVHKSQGSEFEHTVLVLPPRGAQVLTRELVYTGITRARRAFTLVAPEPALFDAALQRRTHRASGLPALLGTDDPATTA